MAGTSKQYNVIVSERAADMLIRQIRFLAQVSPASAHKPRLEIINASKSLQSFPERHLEFSDPLLSAIKYRKMIINRRYLLVYQVKNETVHIDYILDCRQDYQWLL